MTVIPAAILGSAFHRAPPWPLTPVGVDTPFGQWTLHRAAPEVFGRTAYVSFRHGQTHARLPHQIPWRAQASALHHVGVNALLVTSSMGVLDPSLPLHRPIALTDLVMLDPYLADGTPCTMWPTPSADQAHLVWNGPPVHPDLLRELRHATAGTDHAIAHDAVFAWQVGPRTKTAAENRLWRSWGLQVNAMTLAPEVVLACELAIPVVAVGVGHKHSGPDAPALPTAHDVQQSLLDGRKALTAVVQAFLTTATAHTCRHQRYRFDPEPDHG